MQVLRARSNFYSLIASVLCRQNFKFNPPRLNSDAEVRPHPLFAFRRKIANDVAEHSVFAIVFGFETPDNAHKLLRLLVCKGVSQLLCGDVSRAKEQIRRAAVIVFAYRA